MTKESFLTFWNTWKVFIVGLLVSLSMALQEVSKTSADQSFKVYLFAGLIAVLSYISKEWRGKAVTILGIVGTAAGVLAAQLSHGAVNWFEFATATILAIYGAVSPNPLADAKEQETKEAIEFSTSLKQSMESGTVEVNRIVAAKIEQRV
jgi:hypothetical protein